MKEINSKILTAVLTVATSLFLAATAWLFSTVHSLELSMVELKSEIVSIHRKLDSLMPKTPSVKDKEVLTKK